MAYVISDDCIACGTCIDECNLSGRDKGICPLDISLFSFSGKRCSCLRSKRQNKPQHQSTHKNINLET